MGNESEWVCPYCGYKNKGVISGTQIGGSFEDLTKSLSQEANTCEACRKNRVNGEQQIQEFNPRERIGCIIALALIISIPFILWLLDVF